MSEIVFPHTRVEARGALRLRLAVLAAVVVALFAGVSVWLGGSYVGLLGGDVAATARVMTLGDSLGVNSSVKFRGLRVGRVVSLDSARDADGLYRARVVIEDQYARDIPAGALARVVPGTLFGAEFVELRDTAGIPGHRGTVRAETTGGASIKDGDVLQADTSDESIRLMDTFSALYRIIDAVDPAAVDMAMSQLAGALDGRGDDLRRGVLRISKLVDDSSGVEPTFYRDLDLLSRNLGMLANVEPDLAASLRNSLPLARTISAKAKQIDAAMLAGNRLLATVSTFLEKEGPTLVRFLDELRPTYDAFVAGRGPFEAMLAKAPTVLHNGAVAIVDNAIQMAAKFSTRARQPYTSQDCPRYGALRGSNC
ncbi:hypothetical protein GCM10011584_33760 [Nocardioides phosphati]|uniref:MCE family protein n=1 Tax=Nocardioides phosphati TaxID=1867775 RepID=A0ABQ2NFH1_9ACTN|nr:MCE family protein [Nocardioides phosphati]GGO93928.1 hypothetical protein GCM10011584_33760 [Nocardioides phosphati]